MWYGTMKGVRGFKTYRFFSSNSTSGCAPAARYDKNNLLSFVYRRNCDLPDRKTLTEGIRSIIKFRGKYIIVTDYKNYASTIEFYCFLDNIPSEETMKKLENYLKTADF